MRVLPGTSTLVVHAPAKLNLYFEVLGRRDDGYHEIETLMCPINWYDTLQFREDRTGRVTLDCRAASRRTHSVAGLDAVPEGAANLAVRAVELLRRRAGVQSGARMRLIKRIPAAAGLGGGSSDAAAALSAANHGWKLGWSIDRLMRLAAELGSDVPFFLAGGPAICRGRGEIVERVAGLGGLHFVVVKPPAGLSTVAVYAACRPASRSAGVGPLLDALRRGNLPQAGRLLTNRLEPAAEGLCPAIQDLRRHVAQSDFLGYQMSGSGTCYFGLCRHARHARRAARRFQAYGIDVVYPVHSCR